MTHPMTHPMTGADFPPPRTVRMHCLRTAAPDTPVRFNPNIDRTKGMKR